MIFIYSMGEETHAHGRSHSHIDFLLPPPLYPSIVCKKYLKLKKCE